MAYSKSIAKYPQEFGIVFRKVLTTGKTFFFPAKDKKQAMHVIGQLNGYRRALASVDEDMAFSFEAVLVRRAEQEGVWGVEMMLRGNDSIVQGMLDIVGKEEDAKEFTPTARPIPTHRLAAELDNIPEPEKGRTAFETTMDQLGYSPRLNRPSPTIDDQQLNNLLSKGEFKNVDE